MGCRPTLHPVITSNREPLGTAPAVVTSGLRRHYPAKKNGAHRRGKESMHFIALVAVLFLFWLLLSGVYIPFLITAGLGCAILVAWFGLRMRIADYEGQAFHLAPRALTYWPWLAWEIAKAAWDVTKLIVHPRLPISPTMLTVTASQKTAVGVVTYANSITLTPGTISVEVHGHEILVHAITRAGADSLAAGDMDRRVTRFEGAL
jgi:multicomponent Na+:H+ antiporter subunit E